MNIVMKSFVLYECRSVEKNEHLCSLDLKFTEEKGIKSHFGRIETVLFYHAPENSNNRPGRHINSQSWYKNPDGCYCMGITRFALPSSLQGIGLGPVIWSEIFMGLPGVVKEKLKIFGSLNSGDAFTPRTDSDRKLIYETINGQKKINMLNQIKRRNRFWLGMIKPLENTTSTLTCDESGNGAFKGYFKDPLLNLVSEKIILTKANPEQSRLPRVPCKNTSARSLIF